MGFRVREIQILIVSLSFTMHVATASYFIYLSLGFILSNNLGLFWWIKVKKTHKSFSTKQTQHLKMVATRVTCLHIQETLKSNGWGECYYFYFEICLWKGEFSPCWLQLTFLCFSPTKSPTAHPVSDLSLFVEHSALSHLRGLIQVYFPLPGLPFLSIQSLGSSLTLSFSTQSLLVSFPLKLW